MADPALDGLVIDCPYCTDAVSACASFRQLIRRVNVQATVCVDIDGRRAGPVPVSPDALAVHCFHCHDKRRVLTPAGCAVVKLMHAQGVVREEDL